MTQPLEIGGYEIEYDRELTKQCYAKLISPGPESCSCGDCLNWIAARADIITPEIETFLGRFGIPRNGEIESWENGPGRTLAHAYGGWYFIAGRILLGPTPGGRGRGLEVGAFEYDFSEWRSFSVPAFDDEEVFQLNFVTEVRDYRVGS